MIKLTKVEIRDLFDIQDEIIALPTQSSVASVLFESYSGKKYYTVYFLKETREYRIAIYKNTVHKIYLQKIIVRTLGELKKLCNFD